MNLKLEEFAEIDPKIGFEKRKQYPFVEMQDIMPGYRFVSSSQMRSFNGGGANFQTDDTLFARITPCLENGKIAQYKNEREKNAFGSTEFIVLRERRNKSISSFIYYLALSDIIRKPAEKSMFGASGRQRVDLNFLRSIKIPEYSLETQRKIVRILSPIDQLIWVNLKRGKILEKMIQELYEEWFIRFNFAGNEGYENNKASELLLPTNWEDKKLGDLADEVRDSISPDAIDPETPYVGLAHRS